MRDPQHSRRGQTASAVIALLAAWLIASPWLLGIPLGNLATPPIPFALNMIVIGALVLAASAMCLNLGKTTLLSGLEAVLSAWLIVSPWLFGYNSGNVQTWNCIAVGLVIAAIATLSLASTAVRHAGAPRGRPTGRSEHVNH